VRGKTRAAGVPLIVWSLGSWSFGGLAQQSDTNRRNDQATRLPTDTARHIQWPLPDSLQPAEVCVEARQHTLSDWADVETLLYDTNAYAERSLSLPLDVELEFAAGEGI
jgi:hypothetical protein